MSVFSLQMRKQLPPENPLEVKSSPWKRWPTTWSDSSQRPVLSLSPSYLSGWSLGPSCL